MTLSMRTERNPSEDWREYVRRLETERLRVIAENKEKEAMALEGLPPEHQDIETETAVKAKRAAADEFRKAVTKIERRQR